jgi:tRNA nucleotidyltransferase/poly(A) polymerase
MCRLKEEGGRRCNGDNAFGVHIRNLQAKKQYHAKQGHEDKAVSVAEQMDALRQKRAALLVDGGQLLPYSMKLTPSAERVMEQLRQDGYEPYIVGGSVRDALLGTVSKDVDIEVYKADADNVIASLRKIGKVDEVGKSFGVLKISIGKEDFDVSLPRKDSKIGDGHRGFAIEVNPDLSLYEATARRDFTVNALMYDNELGFIIDKHGGLKDLENKQLRHVSDAFDEDPLRVLRGVQMASRFDMELHPSTVEKAESLKPGFKDLAQERVQIEFQKLYEKGKAPAKAFQLLKDTGWDENFSGLHEANTPALHEDLNRTQELIDSKEVPPKRSGVLLSSVVATHLSDDDARKFLASTTVGDDDKNAAYNLSRLEAPSTLNDASVRSWAKQSPRNVTIQEWVLLKKSQGHVEEATKVEEHAGRLGVLNAPEPDMLNGNDIMNLFPGRKPGPWVKPLLDSAREAQYNDIFRTKANGLDWAANNLA